MLARFFLELFLHGSFFGIQLWLCNTHLKRASALGTDDAATRTLAASTWAFKSSRVGQGIEVTIPV